MLASTSCIGKFAGFTFGPYQSVKRKMTAQTTSSESCRRCGTCCKKGGPALHLEDRVLVEEGHIPAQDLYTIRQGEPAFDNVKGLLQPAVTDIIKIKGQTSSWQCRFYQSHDRACRIYQYRPLECRALACSDTTAVENIYDQHRLTRKDLFSHIESLWDLIEDHQQRCDYEVIYSFQRLTDPTNRRQLQKKVLEIIGYDTHLRQLLVAKGQLAAEMLDLLFGRRLAITIKGLGLKIGKEGQEIVLQSDSAKL